MIRETYSQNINYSQDGARDVLSFWGLTGLVGLSCGVTLWVDDTDYLFQVITINEERRHTSLSTLKRKFALRRSKVHAQPWFLYCQADQCVLTACGPSSSKMKLPTWSKFIIRSPGKIPTLPLKPLGIFCKAFSIAKFKIFNEMEHPCLKPLITMSGG